MDVSRVSRRDQGGQWCRHVDRTNSSFLDAYIERDLTEGTLDDAGAQELWDQSVQKLRIVRFLLHARIRCVVQRRPLLGRRNASAAWIRRPGAGDEEQLPHAADALQSRPAPEPNITILWSKHMPELFKRFCVKVSRDTSSLQYENDDLMRPFWAMMTRIAVPRLGYAARQADAVLRRSREPRKRIALVIDGGRDEVSGEQVTPGRRRSPATSSMTDERGRPSLTRQWSGWHGPMCTR